MMKKTIIYILILASVISLGTSCDNFLDTLPDNRTELDTPETISKVLVYAYPRRSTNYLFEMASDNTADNDRHSSYSVMQEKAYAWQVISETDNDSPQHIWEHHYLAIAHANMALQAIEKQGGPASLNPQKGEALLCRAFSHLRLAEMFCKHYSNTASTDLGLPYMTDPETQVLVHYERGTLEEFYKNIAADIEEGLPLIQDNVYEVPSHHFNRKAAHAFAARFYLYYRDYEKAVENATKALGNDPSQYLRDWGTYGDVNVNTVSGGVSPISPASETYTDPDADANLLTVMTVSFWGRVHTNFTRNGNRYSHNHYIGNTETVYSPTPCGTDNGLKRVFKYSWWQNLDTNVVYQPKLYQLFQETARSSSGSSTGTVWTATVPLTTDATLLCRAEAYALMGELELAMEDMRVLLENMLVVDVPDILTILDFYDNMEYYESLNPTPKKAFNTDFTIDRDQENMLHFILHFKRIMTIHEGIRWMDIKRYGIEIDRRIIKSSGTITVTDYLPVNDPRRVFQLPLSVIEAGIEPNPR